MKVTRSDPRYLDHDDHQNAALMGWVHGTTPMGCWADGDHEAFAEAIIDEYHFGTGERITLASIQIDALNE